MFFSRGTLARISSALFALLIAAVVLPFLAAVPASAVPASAAPASAAPADTIHGLVNQARWDVGQRGLIRNPAMDAVALNWAKQMAANSTMSHNPDYSRQIPQGWNSAGENVAQGYRTAQSMHDGWMGSPGHKANILGSFTDVGIAFYESGGTTWGVQVFANYAGNTGPAGPASAPAPAPGPAPAPAPAPDPAPVVDPAPQAALETESSPPSIPSDGGTLEEQSDRSSALNATGSTASTAVDGATRETEAKRPSEMSPTELQASVYGDKPDHTWFALAAFGGVILLGGAIWFLLWRRQRGRKRRTRS